MTRASLLGVSFVLALLCACATPTATFYDGGNALSQCFGTKCKVDDVAPSLWEDYRPYALAAASACALLILCGCCACLTCAKEIFQERVIRAKREGPHCCSRPRSPMDNCVWFYLQTPKVAIALMFVLLAGATVGCVFAATAVSEGRSEFVDTLNRVDKEFMHMVASVEGGLKWSDVHAAPEGNDTSFVLLDTFANDSHKIHRHMKHGVALLDVAVYNTRVVYVYSILPAALLLLGVVSACMSWREATLFCALFLTACVVAEVLLLGWFIVDGTTSEGLCYQAERLEQGKGALINSTNPLARAAGCTFTTNPFTALVNATSHAYNSSVSVLCDAMATVCATPACSGLCELTGTVDVVESVVLLFDNTSVGNVTFADCAVGRGFCNGSLALQESADAVITAYNNVVRLSSVANTVKNGAECTYAYKRATHMRVAMCWAAGTFEVDSFVTLWAVLVLSGIGACMLLCCSPRLVKMSELQVGIYEPVPEGAPGCWVWTYYCSCVNTRAQQEQQQQQQQRPDPHERRALFNAAPRDRDVRRGGGGVGGGAQPQSRTNYGGTGTTARQSGGRVSGRGSGGGGGGGVGAGVSMFDVSSQPARNAGTRGGDGGGGGGGSGTRATDRDVTTTRATPTPTRTTPTTSTPAAAVAAAASSTATTTNLPPARASRSTRSSTRANVQRATVTLTTPPVPVTATTTTATTTAATAGGDATHAAATARSTAPPARPPRPPQPPRPSAPPPSFNSANAGPFLPAYAPGPAAPAARAGAPTTTSTAATNSSNNNGTTNESDTRVPRPNSQRMYVRRRNGNSQSNPPALSNSPVLGRVYNYIDNAAGGSTNATTTASNSATSNNANARVNSYSGSDTDDTVHANLAAMAFSAPGPSTSRGRRRYGASSSYSGSGGSSHSSTGEGGYVSASASDGRVRVVGRGDAPPSYDTVRRELGLV